MRRVCVCVPALLCSPRTPQAHHAMTTWENGGSAGHLVADRRCDVASVLLVGELVGCAGAPSVQLGLCCCRFGLLLLHLFLLGCSMLDARSRHARSICLDLYCGVLPDPACFFGFFSLAFSPPSVFESLVAAGEERV